MSPAIDMSPGVLAVNQVKQLFKCEKIRCKQFDRPDIDASSFDLRLSTTAWQLKEGQRPATQELKKLKMNSSRIKPLRDAKGDYFFFERGKIYLVELDNYLNLPSNINGRATGKSSIGRLDVITRLLTDNSHEYDVVEAGYRGPLHLLVLPQTFSIKVKLGESLNQLRLFSGAPHCSVITRTVIREFGTPFWYVASQNRENYVSWDRLVEGFNLSRTADPTLFDLRVDLADPQFSCIYKAIPKSPEVIDLRHGGKSHNPRRYFERTKIERKGAVRSVVLDEDSFYIMKSKERLAIPPDVAVEVIAISERIGDIRIHYAGFAHPGFGRYKNPQTRGTPLIFEVRATDMPTRLYDGSLLARIQLFRMSTKTIVSKSPYDRQELKLSNVFANWRNP